MKRILKKLLAISLAITTVLTMTAFTASAEDYSSGGYALSTANQTVWQSNSTSSAQVGTLYALEGFTILYGVGDNLYIEYSTSSGAKRGYLVNPLVDWRWTDTSAAAYVKSTTNLYYGPNSGTYELAGTVYAGEFVAALAAEGNWAYVEYNTTAGRKRGYMPVSSLTIYNQRVWNGSFYTAGSPTSTGGRIYIRSGPGDNYPSIGYVENENFKVGTRFPLYGNYVYRYVEYTVDSSGKIKSGYIGGYE